jgi:predicted metalloprotease with PDZ domain
MKSKSFFISLLLVNIVFINTKFLFANKNKMDAEIVYKLSMPHPNTHYFEVEMDINIDKYPNLKDFFDLKMPVWTPGSYLVREYSKNVEGFEALEGNKKIKASKISKNTWRISGFQSSALKIKYKVYAFELTVRTSYLDDSHGYVNGASMFMYIPQLMKEKSILKVIPHKSFRKVSVALPLIDENEFQVENFDTLVDSPIEIGNHEIIEFESMGVKHTIANYSIKPLVYDKVKLISDYKKVVEAAASVVNDKHPCQNYLFIIHHLPGIGGGLEHLNSTTCQTSDDVYQNESKYIGFLGLLAHEYFHLWNIKRIRPIVLGPFDYENENYTNMLWVAEGFTSFYQDDILRRAGIIDENTFLKMCANKIGSVINTPGNKIQSVTEASMDAWIKFYRPNENSNNSTISYYTKGGIIAQALNLMIINESKGQRSLDDVFRILWKNNFKERNIGYTDDEFKDACEKAAGINLEAFFKNQIYGMADIDFKEYYGKVGIEFKNNKAYPNEPWIGINARNSTVVSVSRGSGAFDNGIYVGDEILKVDNKDFKGVNDFLSGKKVGDQVNIRIYRSGIVKDYDIPLVENPNLRIELNAKDKGQKYKKYMHL